MHPTIAAFIDVRTAIDTLERAVGGEPLSAEQGAYVAAARQHAELSSLVLQSKGRKPGEQAQNATILLGVRAALAMLPQDPVLGPAALRARNALAAAGADTEQVEQLLGGVLVEEAFTGDNDPTRFDRDFVLESFGELPELAKLDEDRVGGLVEAFAETARPEQRALHLQCAETLFQSAWGEGPQSVNVEHVEDTLQQLADPRELEAVKATLEVLLRFLSAHRLVGPLRLQRLLETVADWRANGNVEDEDEDDVDGEDEDEVDDAN